jgi:uncharacterized protein
METLLAYGTRIAPGLAALLLMLVLLPRRAAGLRITIYIAFFIVIRDAMTPAGLWSFGPEGFFWIRFIDSLPLLLLFAAGSSTIAAAMLLAEPDLRKRIRWLVSSSGFLAHTGLNGSDKGSGRSRGRECSATGAAFSLLMGAAGALLTAGPLLLVYTAIPIEVRGGGVAAALLPGIAAVTFLGNFYEELLFRGFLQDHLQEDIGLTPVQAALTSGAAFAAGHSFLAVTVSSAGAPLLLFVLYEGIIAGLIRMRWGLIPAIISHGGAIFLLAGGLV